MHNNQQILPIDRFLLQPMQYDVNNPPFTPNIQVSQWMQPYLRYLTGVMMDLITKGAQGPLTVHFYNRMTANNWANPDFVMEVHNCADFVYLKTNGGQGTDPGNAIIRLVPAYLSLRSFYELKLNQQLWQFVDPADQASMQQSHFTFEQELAAINQLRTGGVAPQGVAVPIGQPMMGNRQPSYPQAAPMGGMMPQPMQPQYMSAPVGVAGRGPAAGRDYGNSAPNVAAPAPVAAMMPMAAPVMQAAPQPAPVAAPAPAQQGQLVEMGKATWNPSEEMPYPMAFNPVTTKMFYVIENGKTIPQPVKNEIDMINYERHSITSMFGHVPDNLPVVKDNGEIMRNVTEAVRAAEQEAANVDEEDSRIEEAMGLKNILTVTSLDAAIQDARIEMLSKIDRGHPPMVFQAYANVYAPIIHAESQYALLNKFADSSSYIELREKIRAAGATAAPELLTEVILRSTALVNSILWHNLSIMPSEITVDDFVQDLDPLLNLLKSNYSEKVQKAFLKNQAQRIKAMFNMPDVGTENGKKIHDLMSENSLTTGWEGREGEAPELTFFGSTIRLSFLNVISHDLLLGGLTKVGNILTRQQMPALYELARQVLTANDHGLNVARQLVITKDGRIVELTEGYLVEGSYLVSLVK
jgi:hypothetical protein